MTIEFRPLKAEEIEVRDVPGYEGLYVATSDGRVIGCKSGKELKCHRNNGYEYVKLYRDAVGKTIRVHRIIAQTFIPNPDNKPQVNHINSNRHDNRVDNLEWVTQSENLIHAYRYGNLDPSVSWGPMQKEVAALDDNGKAVMRFESLSEAARQLGLNVSNICNACHGRIKKTGGYQWRLVSDL